MFILIHSFLETLKQKRSTILCTSSTMETWKTQQLSYLTRIAKLQWYGTTALGRQLRCTKEESLQGKNMSHKGELALACYYHAQIYWLSCTVPSMPLSALSFCTYHVVICLPTAVSACSILSWLMFYTLFWCTLNSICEMLLLIW
jgi:hypothetical protein